MQFLSSWRVPWRSFAAQFVSLVLASVAVGGPFVAITGHITTKPSGNQVLKLAHSGSTGAMSVPSTHRQDASAVIPGNEGYDVPCYSGGPLLASTLAMWWPEDKANASSNERILWGLGALLT